MVRWWAGLLGKWMSSRALGMVSVVGVGHTSCVLEHEVWGYHSPGTDRAISRSFEMLRSRVVSPKVRVRLAINRG